MVVSSVATVPLEINRTKLHKETGYSLSHVSRVLSGQRRPSLRCAGAIAQALGLTVDELIDLLPAA